MSDGGPRPSPFPKMGDYIRRNPIFMPTWNLGGDGNAAILSSISHHVVLNPVFQESDINRLVTTTPRASESDRSHPPDGDMNVETMCRELISECTNVILRPVPLLPSKQILQTEAVLVNGSEIVEQQFECLRQLGGAECGHYMLYHAYCMATEDEPCFSRLHYFLQREHHLTILALKCLREHASSDGTLARIWSWPQVRCGLLERPHVLELVKVFQDLECEVLFAPDGRMNLDFKSSLSTEEDFLHVLAAITAACTHHRRLIVLLGALNHWVAVSCTGIGGNTLTLCLADSLNVPTLSQSTDQDLWSATLFQLEHRLRNECISWIPWSYNEMLQFTAQRIEIRESLKSLKNLVSQPSENAMWSVWLSAGFIAIREEIHHFADIGQITGDFNSYELSGFLMERMPPSEIETLTINRLYNFCKKSPSANECDVVDVFNICTEALTHIDKASLSAFMNEWKRLTASVGSEEYDSAIQLELPHLERFGVTVNRISSIQP